MNRNTITFLALILLVASLLAQGCSAPKVQIDAKTSAAVALTTNLVMTWTVADTDRDGSLNHVELAAAGLRTLNEIARAYPDKVTWEGRMRTEQGRQEFIEAIIVLYIQYTAPLPTSTPAPAAIESTPSGTP